MASNVYRDKIHIEQFLEEGIDFEEVKENNTFTFSITKSNFKKSILEVCENDDISKQKITIFLEFLKTIEELPLENFNFIFPKLSSLDNQIKEKNFTYLSILKAVRQLILNTDNLSSDDKAEFCKIERQLMKMYLSDLIVKL